MTYHDYPPQTIGFMLADIRAERGISQLRLAERLCAASGVSTVTRNEISRWEREERIPSGFWLGWLANVLALPLDELESAAAAARRGRALSRRRPCAGGIRWTQTWPGVFTAIAS